MLVQRMTPMAHHRRGRAASTTRARILVTVAGRGGVPFVVDRRSVALIGDGLPSAPYHHEAQTLARPAAAELIGRVRAAIDVRAAAALRDLERSVRAHCRLLALAHRTPRPLPSTLDGFPRFAARNADCHAEMYLVPSRAGQVQPSGATCAGGTGWRLPPARSAQGRQVDASSAGCGRRWGPPGR